MVTRIAAYPLGQWCQRIEQRQRIVGSAQIGDAKPGADVKVAQLADAQTFKIRMQAGNWKIGFSDLKVGPFHDRAESGSGERRGYRCSSGGANQSAAPGRMFDCRVEGEKSVYVVNCQ